MANIKSFPNNRDEYIGAESVMRWLHGRTSGVFGADGNAAVEPVLGTMSVTVSDGTGWMANDNADGVVWWIDQESETGSKLQVAVDMADALLNRIDRVVVSWNTTNYADLPQVIVLKGTPASNPTAPTLTNNNTIRQISLAAISVPAGTTTITGMMITDERLDDSVCGIVTAGVGIDTTMLNAQIEQIMQDFNGYMEQQETAWDNFFAHVQSDTHFPVPTIGDAGKTIAVNETCDAYVLKQNHLVFNANIPVSSWSNSVPYLATIQINGILASDTPHVSPVFPESTEQAIALQKSFGRISTGEAMDGAISFKCFQEKPDLTISIQVEVNR